MIAHVHRKQYAEALEVALKYDMDTDIIYKEKYEASKRTLPADSVRSELEPIKDLKWKINACLNIISESQDAQFAHYTYGLELTNSAEGKLFVAQRRRILSALDKLHTVTTCFI